MKFDIAIRSVIETTIQDKTAILTSVIKYNNSNSSYKNFYKFDIKKPGPNSLWVMREFTNV